MSPISYILGGRGHFKCRHIRGTTSSKSLPIFDIISKINTKQTKLTDFL